MIVIDKVKLKEINLKGFKEIEFHKGNIRPMNGK